MTVWEKVENEDCYAVAIYNYTGSGSRVPHLPLTVGELVRVERRAPNWLWGRSLRKDACGLFPAGYVCERPCQVQWCGDTVLASSGGDGVVHDIALTLREWLEHWKQLYINNDLRFTFMEVSMRTLLELRAQLTSRSLPGDQLRRLTRTATRAIDKGQRTLGMELAVRDAEGALLDPRNYSVYELDALHHQTNKRLDKNMEATPSLGPKTSPSVGKSVSIHVCVHNLICRVSAPRAQLLLSLYDSAARLTEPALLRWPPHVAAHSSHVLFTDLPSSMKSVFLVCMIVRVGPMEVQNSEQSRRISMTGAWRGGGGTGGGTTEVGGGGGGVTEEGGGGGGCGTEGVRRACGVAVADITTHLKENAVPDRHIQLPFTPYEKENMDTMVKKIIANRELKDTKQTQGLWVTVQLLEGDNKQSVEQYRGCAISRALAAPEVAEPGDARNELFVTLCAATYVRTRPTLELCARLYTAGGVLLQNAISVGSGVPNVDQYTSLVYYHDEKPRWNETFKVCLGTEEFKEAHLVILARHRSSSEAKDRSERPFALSYVRLMMTDGTTLPNGEHNLNVYKIDYKRSTTSQLEAESTVNQAASSCLTLPSLRSALPAGFERGLKKDRLTLVPKAHLLIKTHLVSAKLTQKEEILGVLKWKTLPGEDALKEALQRLLTVPSEELIKFLPDILDALAHIITQVEEDSREYTPRSIGVLVLDDVLRVCSLVLDHKFQHFQPLLHAYIDDTFCDAMFYEKLLPVLTWVVLSCESGEGAMKRLLQSMKCLECLMRLVVRSRLLRHSLAADPAHDHTFMMLFESLMESLCWLMRRGPAALTCQGSALKYLPYAVPHLVRVYPDTKLCSVIVGCLSSLPLALLGKQRVQSLVELTRGPLGARPAPRRLLLPHVAATVVAMLRDDQESWSRMRVGKAARLLGAECSQLSAYDSRHERQLVELCVEALGELVSLVTRSQDDGGGEGAEELSRRTLPAVVRAAAGMMREHHAQPPDATPDPLLRRCICVLLDMVGSMTPEQYRSVAHHLSGAGEESLAGEALSLLRSLLQKPVFPDHWADMLHRQYHICMHALRLLSRTVEERLHSTPPEGPGPAHVLARSWFSAAGELATSGALQTETATASRRRRVLALYGDLRVDAARAIQDLWHLLGPHKRYLVPEIVGPLLEASLVRSPQARELVLPIFYDMCQVTPNNTEYPGVEAVQRALVQRLDRLAAAGAGDPQWRQLFLAAAAPSLPGAALLADTIDTQLLLLLEYREASDTQPDYRMYMTVRLMNFYRDIQRTELYVRYIHLVSMSHRALGQWAEAAAALRLHAQLLSWTEESLPSDLHLHLRDLRDLRDLAGTHAHLKEALYLEMMECLQEGKQFEGAVEVVKELVAEYERRPLAYRRLADLHAHLACLYRDLYGEERQPPQYFRVIYHGRGFPEHLRNEHGFVYRGNELEQLASFKDRLLNEWPKAQVLNKLDPPGEDITLSDGQFLQVNAVEPVMDEQFQKQTSRLYDHPILQYCKYNNVDTFTFSRPFYRPEEGLSEEEAKKNEFASLWLERTEIKTTEKFPGTLRWQRVRSSLTSWLCPLQAALERMRDSHLQLRAAAAPRAPPLALSMRLQGILNPAVQGGIDNYERAFFTSRYELAHPEHSELLQQLKDAIAEQIPLLEYALHVHGERCGSTSEALHAHLEECFNNLRDHVYKHYGRKSLDLETETELGEISFRRARTSAMTDPGPDCNDRTSDIAVDSGGKSKFLSFNSTGVLSLKSPLSRYSSAGYFGTLNNTPKRRNRKQVRKSEISNASTGSSQWYTTHNGSHSALAAALAPLATPSSLHVPPSSSLPHVFLPPPSSVPLSPTPSLSTLSSPAPSSVRNSVTSPCDSNHSASPLRELRQELVCARPPRAEAERRASRSSQLMPTSDEHSNRDSLGTTDSNQDEEEPPPLPMKSHTHSRDYDNNNNDEQPPPPPPPHQRHNYDTVVTASNNWTPRGSFLYNSLASRRRNQASPASSATSLNYDQDRAPTPPPKKHQHNNN